MPDYTKDPEGQGKNDNGQDKVGNVYLVQVIFYSWEILVKNFTDKIESQQIDKSLSDFPDCFHLVLARIIVQGKDMLVSIMVKCFFTSFVIWFLVQ